MIAHLSTFYHHAAGRATGIVFLAMGFTFGSWAALIPYVKDKFQLDEAQLGILLLAFPLGVTLMNPLSVPLLRRFGTRKATLGSLMVMSFLFIFPPAMPSALLVGLMLFLCGSALATTNVTMNTCATQLEQHSNLGIMAACHGLWSLGAMLGSVASGFSAGKGVAPSIYMVCLFLVIVTIITQLWKPLAGIPEDPHPVETASKKKRGFVMPNRALWVLIILSLCTNLTEGTMTEWSAVYMKDVVAVPEMMASWGFAAYASLMAAGRFLGDSLIAKFGSKKMLQTGGGIVLVGLVIIIFCHNMVPSLIGFACVGAGVSLGAPILYAASAKVPGMAKGAGLAIMNTFAMAGFLSAPAIIGLIAHSYSLPVAFGWVAMMVLLWIFMARKV